MFKTGFITLLSLMLITPSIAGNGNVKLENKLKEYFHNTAERVHKAETSAEKREILDNSLDKLTEALNRVEKTNLTDSDAKAVKALKNRVAEKTKELNGLEGYDKVANAQLDNFADYVQQDMEQANRYITISVTTVLLIIIILLLI